MNRLHHETDSAKGEYSLARDELTKAQSAFYNQQQAGILNVRVLLSKSVVCVCVCVYVSE